MVNDLTFAPAPTMLESLHAAVAEQNSAISLIKKHEDDFGVGRSSGLADGAHLLSAACAAVAALCKASSTIERLMTIEADTDDARRVEVKKKKEKSSGESLSRRTSGKRVSGTFGRASGTFGGSADDGTEDGFDAGHELNRLAQHLAEHTEEEGVNDIHAMLVSMLI